MPARKAVEGDVPSMVELSELKRTQYEIHSPVFWRKAERSAELQRAFFAKLLNEPDWLLLVNEESGRIDAFIIGRLMQAPPVYDPGGKACLIDDFAVEKPENWSTSGVVLHQALESEAKSAGAVVTITVAGAHDEQKRAALLGIGAHLASEWYVHQIAV